MSKERPTMRDVAELAGVTQPTVSYVINGTANISDEVKEKVNKAIKKLNYKPNYYARVLKTNKTNIIGIIIPDISNEYYSKIVNFVEKLLVKQNYTVVISSTNYDKKTEENSIKHLLAYHAEGIIVTYQLENQKCWKMLRKSAKGVVVLEGGSHCEGLPCLNTDNHYGGYIAASYLLKQGRTKIAYVGQNSTSEALTDRCQGFVDAMKENGIPPKNIYHTSGPGEKWKEGRLIGQQLINEDIDGIVVSSDIVAVGIIKTLMVAGKRIPRDIAIIGYDDIPLAELFVPSLTTVAQPIEQLCTLAVNKIFQMMTEGNSGNERLRPELMIRETT